MPTAILCLVGAVAWMLYRRQSADGTLPGGLTIRGAEVAVTNVDAVERRRVWRYTGPAGLWALNLPTGLSMTGSNRASETYKASNQLRLVPGGHYSHRVALESLRADDPDGQWWMRWVVPDWSAWDSWWAPEIMTVAEAQAADVVEVPEALQFSEPVTT